MRRAAAYIRVSTEDQLEYSPDSQRKLIARYAVQHGWELPEELIFIDEGISGRKAEKRPAFLRMIAMAKQKPRPFSAILVYSFSRFARNREDSVVYKRMLRKDLGVELISISQDLGNDKTSILVEAMLEAMDEYYSIDLGENVKRGMVEKVERGEPVAPAPFGYRMHNRCYVPDPERAALVTELFRLFAGGAGYRELAARLNAMGVPTSRGNLWEPRAVAYLLQNPVYAGKIRWCAGGRAGRGAAARMVTQGGHTPLVPEDLWQSAQERASQLHGAGNRRDASAANADQDGFPLQGLVRCGSCGGALVRSGKQTMQCSRYAKGKCAVSHSVGRDALWEMTLHALLFDVGDIPLKMPAPKKRSDPLAESARRLAGRRLKRIQEAYAAGVDTLAEYERKKRAILEALNACEVPGPTAAVQEESPSTWGEYLRGAAMPSEKNRLLGLLLDRIVFDRPDRLTLYYKG